MDGGGIEDEPGGELEASFSPFNADGYPVESSFPDHVADAGACDGL